MGIIISRKEMGRDTCIRTVLEMGSETCVMTSKEMCKNKYTEMVIRIGLERKRRYNDILKGMCRESYRNGRKYDDCYENIFEDMHVSSAKRW